MKIFAVKNKDGNLVAYHVDRKVVEEFFDNSRSSGSDDCYEIKKYKINDSDSFNKKYGDYYLVPYNMTWVQQGFITYLELRDSNTLRDIIFARDVLSNMISKHIIECKSDKQSKHIQKTLNMIDKVIADFSFHTESISSLNSMKDYYEPFKNSDYMI